MSCFNSSEKKKSENKKKNGTWFSLGFRAGWLDAAVSSSLTFFSHFRERDKMLLRAILSGKVWNGFLHSKVEKENVLWRFCGDDGHFLHFPSLRGASQQT